MQRIRNRPDALNILKKCFRQADNRDRQWRVTRVIADSGAVTRKTETATRQNGWLTKPDVVATLVELVDTDDWQVSEWIAGTLVNECTDEAVRPHAMQIVATVKKRKTHGFHLLLGKTGCAEARELLRQDPGFRQCSGYSTELALAKLGDAELELKFIKRFLDEKDPQKRMRLAENLGYLATPGAVGALASQLRTSEVYRDGDFAFSLRVAVIEALSKAMPENPLFWRPDRVPESDEYYAQIEKWAEDVMQIKWDKPRPPFCYICNML